MRTDTPMTDTQRRILDATFDVWASDPPATLFGGLSVARIAKAAGVTRSTFYAYWPTSEAYLHDVLRHLATRSSLAPPGRAVESLDTSAPRSPEMVDRFMHAATVLLDAAAEDQAFLLRQALLGKADEPEIATLLRDLYRAVEAPAVESFARNLHEWGREPRPPLHLPEIVAVITAMLDGLAIRRIFDPEMVPDGSYGYAMLSFLMFATRPLDDDRSLDAILDAANNWPAMGLALRLRQQTQGDQDFAPSDALTPREVIVAARRLLTRTNYVELTFAEVAAITRVPELTLQQWFGSKAGLGLGIYMLNVAERYDQIDPSLRGMDRLREMVEINLTEVDRQPALAQAVLLLLTGATANPRMSVLEWDPRPRMVEAIAEAIADGDLHTDLDPSQFSAVLQRVMTIDRTPPGSMFSRDIDATELFLRGAGAPPRPN